MKLLFLGRNTDGVALRKSTNMSCLLDTSFFVMVSITVYRVEAGLVVLSLKPGTQFKLPYNVMFFFFGV